MESVKKEVGFLVLDTVRNRVRDQVRDKIRYRVMSLVSDRIHRLEAQTRIKVRVQVMGDFYGKP